MHRQCCSSGVDATATGSGYYTAVLIARKTEGTVCYGKTIGGCAVIVSAIEQVGKPGSGIYLPLVVKVEAASRNAKRCGETDTNRLRSRLLRNCGGGIDR